MNMPQATEELAGLAATVAAIKDGVTVLLQRIADLTAVIEAGGAGSTTPEFDAALASLKSQISEVQAMVPAVEA